MIRHIVIGTLFFALGGSSEASAKPNIIMSPTSPSVSEIHTHPVGGHRPHF